MKVILISGKAQSGKDTTAEILRSKLESDNKTVLLTHYADLLKYICGNYFGWNGSKDEKGRQMLQYVGTDVIRKQNPSFWVDFVATILKLFKDRWDYVIIPDTRFPNEISVMIDNGFEVTHLRVERASCDSPLTEEQKNHPSETALDGVKPDYLILNNGTLKELNETITKWTERTLYGK